MRGQYSLLLIWSIIWGHTSAIRRNSRFVRRALQFRGNFYIEPLTLEPHSSHVPSPYSANHQEFSVTESRRYSLAVALALFTERYPLNAAHRTLSTKRYPLNAMHRDHVRPTHLIRLNLSVQTRTRLFMFIVKNVNLEVKMLYGGGCWRFRKDTLLSEKFSVKVPV